jgi:hypothetical protein
MPIDSFEYLYKVWWYKHALFDLQVSPFFDPSIFYPFGYHVAMTELTLSNIIPALPLTAFFGEVIAYNLTMLSSFALSGLGMYLLVFHLCGSKMAGLVSGVVFAFCPYRMAQIGGGHLPLMGTQWLPLLLLYLDRMITRRRGMDAFMAGLFYALGALSAWYYAYMFAMAGILYVLLRGKPWKESLFRREFALCAVIFALVTLVLVGLPLLQVVSAQMGGSRWWSLQYVDRFSASPLDFVYPNVLHPLWGHWLMTRYRQGIPESILYLGLTPLALSLIALRHQKGRTRRAVAWMSLAFAVLALGTTLHWRNAPLYVAVPDWLERIFTIGMNLLTKRLALYPISSYSLRMEGAVYLPLPALLLYLYLPFFNSMRVWSRFGLITVFGVSVLAGMGLLELHSRIKYGTARVNCLGVRQLVVTASVVLVVLLEFAAFPYALGTSSTQARPVDQWLAAQDGDFTIMEYPLIKAVSGRSLYSIRTHGKRIGFGQSTLFPEYFVEHRPVLEQFPSRDSIALLEQWEVRYVLVGARSYGTEWPEIERDLASSPDLRHVLSLDDLPIYEGDRVLHLMPGAERTFIVDRIHVYEVL